MTSGRALIMTVFAVITTGLASGVAHADAPPVVIVPFQARCFDANALATAVRIELPELTVHVGGVHDGARQEVRVEGQEHLVLHIVARGVDGRELGSEQRTLPDADCATLLEAAELIVARAATPLRFRDVDAQKRATKPAHPTTPKPPVDHEPPTRSPSPTPPPSQPATTSPTPSPTTSPLPSESEASPSPNPSRATPAAKPPRADGDGVPQPTLRKSAPSRLPPHPFEIDLGAAWIFPLEGQPSTALGELALGLRLPHHLGVGLRAGVAAAWSTTTTTNAVTASVSARRIPLVAELRVDLPVWHGGFRFSAGPLATLWHVQSQKIGHPGQALVVEPGADLRVAYRFEISRFILEAAVHGDVAFGVDQLSVAGVGTVARTPRVDLGPELAVGVRL